MARDYLPANDLVFLDWYTNFVTYLGANAARLGITPEQVAALDTELTVFTGALSSYHTLRDQTSAASKGRTEKRVSATSAVRPVVSQVQSNPNTTQADRDMLRIPTRDGSMEAAELEADDNKPHAVIDIRQRLRHVLHIENQSTTTTSKGKPAGVVGAEIWRKIGDPPQTDEDYQLVEMVLKSRHTIEYPLSDGNKQVHYRLRWVNAKGEKGAWGEVESATIAA